MSTSEPLDGRAENLAEPWDELEATPLGDAIAVSDGHMKVPQGPGLGIDVDEGVIARYRVA